MDYSQLDNLILRAVQAGLSTDPEIAKRCAASAAIHNVTPKGRPSVPDANVVTRRLAFLRKHNKLLYSRTAGWAIPGANTNAT